MVEELADCDRARTAESIAELNAYLTWADVPFPERQGESRFAVGELLWTSPPEEIDVTIVRLCGDLASLEPLTLSRDLPPIGENLYLAGHPDGGSLAISSGPLLSVGVTCLRHRCETRPGSGGSALFDSVFRLLGIHHQKHVTGPQEGVGEAVPMAAIREALRVSL